MVENHSKIRKPEALGGWLRTTASTSACGSSANGGGSTPRRPRRQRFPDATVDVEQTVVDADTVPAARPGHHAPAALRLLLTELFRDEPPGYAELARLTGIPIGSIGPTRGRALQCCAGCSTRARRGHQSPEAPDVTAGARRWPARGCARRSCGKIRVRCTPTVFSLM